MEKGDYTKKKFAKTPLLNKSTAHTSETRVGQTSTNSIPRFDSKNNISAKKISDNGNESDIENGLKSKDDTIYDDDFEQAWWDSVAGTLET